MFNDSTSQQVFLFLLTRCLFVGRVLCVCVFSDAARYVPTFSCLFCGIVGTLRAASAHIAGEGLLSHNTLCHHGLGNLHESGNVCALHIVYISVGLGTVLHAVLVDVLHDGVQTAVHFFSCPAQSLRVL